MAAAAPPEPRPGLRLDVQGQPDADQAAVGAGLLLVLAELLIADQLGRLLQALLRADALVHHLHGVGVGQLVTGDHVAAAELQRVEAQLLRDGVHHDLPARGLHHPRPAVGAVPAGVRVDRLPRVGHRTRPGPVVGPGEDAAGQPGGLAVAAAGEGADVLDVVGLRGQQHAILVGGRGDLQRFLAGVAAADQVLGPVLDPLHRAVAEQHGGHHDGLLFLLEADLLAEGAADIVHHDVDVVGGKAQHPGQERPGLVHALTREDQFELLGPDIPLGDQAAGLHRDVDVPVLIDRLVEDVRRLLQQFVHAGQVPGGQDAGQVVRQGRVHPRAALGQRLRRGDHRILRLDVHDDQLGGILGQVPRLGDHDGDRVTDIADVTVGEHLPRGMVGGPAGQLVRRRVGLGRGQHGDHARHLPGLAGVQVHDPARGHGAAHERGMHHPGLVQVIDVPAVPGDHPLIFGARHPLPDPPRRNGHSGIYIRANGWTPSTSVVFTAN